MESKGIWVDEKREVGELSFDREVACWVARLGAVSVDQIGRRFGVGRSVAYELVRRLVGLGLLGRTLDLAVGTDQGVAVYESN